MLLGVIQQAIRHHAVLRLLGWGGGAFARRVPGALLLY